MITAEVTARAVPRKIDLTMFTDASLDRDGAAGWGVWMKGNSGSFTGGGPILAKPSSSTEAEIMALANGLAVARNKGMIGAGGVLMVQADNISALAWIIRAYPKAADRPAPSGMAVPIMARKTKPMAASRGLAVFVEMAADLDLFVITRHVKGHKGGPNRQWVNRVCDKIALAGRKVAAGKADSGLATKAELA